MTDFSLHVLLVNVIVVAMYGTKTKECVQHVRLSTPLRAGVSIQSASKRPEGRTIYRLG